MKPSRLASFMAKNGTPGANPLKSVFPEEPQISLREEPQVPFNGLLREEDLQVFPKTCKSSLKTWVSASLQGRLASFYSLYIHNMQYKFIIIYVDGVGACRHAMV